MERNNDSLIKKYKELVEMYKNVLKTVKNDDAFINNAKESIEVFINRLAIIDKENKEKYEEMLREILSEDVKLADENNQKEIEEKTKEPEELSVFGKYIEENIYKAPDRSVKEELDRLSDQIIEDLKNPNDLLIETWLKNYSDFIEKNELEEKYMIEYMKNIFKKHDTGNRYTDNIEEMYFKAKEESKTEELEQEEKKPEEKIEEVKTEGASIDTVEEEKEEINKEEASVEETVEIPEVKEQNEKVQEKDSTEDKKNEKIKIVSTKKTTLSRAEKLTAGALSILCLSTPFITPAVVVAFLTHRIVKNHKYKNKKLMDFLKENGFDLNNELELIDTNNLDEHGNPKIVTNEELGQERYEAVKRELMEIGALESKLISDDYKKSKLHQIMIKLNPVTRIKEKYQEMKKNLEEKKEKMLNATSYLEEQEIKSGMGRF